MSSRIAQALRGLSLNASLESDTADSSVVTGDGEQTVTAQVEEAQATPADGEIAAAEEQNLETTTVEVAEGTETEQAETVVTDSEVVVSSESEEAAAPAAEEAAAPAEGEVEASTTTGDGEQVVEAAVEAADETPADGAAAPGEDQQVEAVVVEVAEGAETESAETEVSGEAITVSQEGFAGAVVGFLVGAAGWTPFVGAAIHAAAKAKRLKLREDIQTIAKRIEKVRKGQIEKAQKEGLELPKSLQDVDYIEIIKSAFLGQFFGGFYGAWQGGDMEELNKELKAKLKELADELDSAGISTESYADGEAVPADVEAEANAAAAAAAAHVAEGAAAAAEAAAAAANAVIDEASSGDAAEAAADAGEATSDAAEVAEEAAADATDVADDEIEAGDAEIEAIESDIADGEEHAAEYEEASATMESLIEALQDAQRTGGLTPQSARFFNIGFESIGVRLTGKPFENARGESAIPSMESFGGTMRRDHATQISMEAAGDWFKKILEVLQKTWATIVDWVKKFVAAVFSQAARFNQRADAILAATKKINGVKPKAASFTFQKADKIVNGQRVDIDTLDMVLGVAAFASERAQGGHVYAEAYAKLLNETSSKLKSITDKEGWQTLVNGLIETGLNNLDKGGLDQTRSALFKHRRTEGLEIIYSTDELPGNVVLEMSTFEQDLNKVMEVANEGPGAYVKAALRKAVKQGKTVVKPTGKEMSEDARELPTLSVGQIAQVAKSVKQVLLAAKITDNAIKNLKSDFRASVQTSDDQSTMAKVVIQTMAGNASKVMSDYCGGVSKAVKYAVGTAGVFLEYANASLKQYEGEKSADELAVEKMAAA